MPVSKDASTRVHVEVTQSVQELGVHAEAWDRLALAAPERIPQLSHAWVATFLESAAALPFYCLFAYIGAELVGVLPVIRSRRWGVARLTGPQDAHLEHGHPLLAPESSHLALPALMSAMDRLEPHRWMRFFRVRESSPFLPALATLQPSKLVLQPLVRPGCLVDTSGSLEDYEAQLSRSMRRDLRKAQRRAEAEHHVEVEVVDGPEAAREDLLEDFLRIEASGWKGAQGSAIACDPERVRFYTTLTRRLAARGWLEWSVLRFDGRAVASVLGVRLGTSLLVPKAAYDESLARYSPGQVLYWHVFRRAFAEDTVEVNFQTSRPWMHVWHMAESMYHDVSVSPRAGAAAVASRLDALEPRRRASRFAHEHPELLEAVRRGQERLGLLDRAPRPGSGS